MQNEISHDKEYILQLKKAIYEQYGISAVEITPAERGYYGETWKIHAGSDYFLKMDYLPFHQKRFQQSLFLIEYLCESGIDFVGRIIKTRENKLYSRFNTAVIGLFEWIDATNVETDETKSAEYQLLCQIYLLSKPGLNIPTALFSDDAAMRFYQQWDRLKSAPKTDANCTVLSIFEHFKEEISHCAVRLSHFAGLCRQDESSFYLTHGDAGGNFFIGSGKNYILDWDEAMYAPIERDAWVMGCYDWARKLFNDTLRTNGIPYQLRPERLAFYCYHMYFFYLNEFLAVHSISDKSQRIAEYFENCWIKTRIKFADAIE